MHLLRRSLLPHVSLSRVQLLRQSTKSTPSPNSESLAAPNRWLPQSIRGGVPVPTSSQTTRTRPGDTAASSPRPTDSAHQIKQKRSTLQASGIKFKRIMSTDQECDAYITAINSLNSSWRISLKSSHPQLFTRLAAGQSPQILWIGCSDSRCPETTILGLQPGDVFVHRNIANILTPTDLNSLSVIQYAVQYLKVKHVVVCGHTSCGGVAAALGNKKLGLIDTWLMPLRTLRRENLELLNGLDDKQRGLKLVELNVRNGVKVLQENPVILEAMTERSLKVHGLIYDVGCGELKELDIDEDEEIVKSRLTAFKTE